MWNRPDLELRGLRVGVERALVRQQRGPKPEHRAVVLERHLAVHVVVAREPGRDQVLRALLDPLHRVAQQERGGGRHHVAGVHRHLVAEPAADVGRDDPDLLLGQPGHEREHRADRVGRLRGHVDGGLAGGGVDVGDAAARLQRRRDGSAGRTCRALTTTSACVERLVGGLLVAGLPVVDVVVRLPLLVVRITGRVGLQRALRRHDRLQRVVVDVDQLQRVLRDVGVGGDRPPPPPGPGTAPCR